MRMSRIFRNNITRKRLTLNRGTVVLSLLFLSFFFLRFWSDWTTFCFFGVSVDFLGMDRLL